MFTTVPLTINSNRLI